MSAKESSSTVLVGGGMEVLSFYSRLKRPERVCGIFCPYGVRLPEGLQRLGEMDDVAEYVNKNVNIKKVYCGISGISLNEVRSVQNGCKARAVKFCVVLPVVSDLNADFVVAKAGKSVVLTPKGEPLSYMYNRMIKRFFDLFFVILFMLTFFPFVYIFKAILAKCKKRGSSFCTQACVGPSNRPFNRVAFRGDKRSLARVFNVLKGEMSLVGPTYYDLEEGMGLDDLPRRLARRHLKPGMASYAHVKKVDSDPEARLEADIWYAEHWSLWTDISILFRSLFV